MTHNQDIRSGRHCVFALHAHLVFVTKYRRGVFRQEHMSALERIFRSVCHDFETELVEFNGETDHVHLLVNYPPKTPLSKLATTGRSGLIARTSG